MCADEKVGDDPLTLPASSTIGAPGIAREQQFLVGIVQNDMVITMSGRSDSLQLPELSVHFVAEHLVLGTAASNSEAAR